MKIYNYFTLVPLIILSISCTKDNPITPEVIIDPAIQNLKSISYPWSQDMPYSQDKQDFEYDSQRRISKILSGNEIIAVNYLNSNLFQTTLVQSNVSNATISHIVSYHLIDNKIDKIIGNYTSRYTNSLTTYRSKDSTQYTYINGFVTKIQRYNKTTESANFPNYRSEDKMDYIYSEGNITQTQRVSLIYGNYISNFIYDDKPYISMGEFAYETPAILNRVLHEKYIGKKTKNNIIKVENIYPQIPFQKSFENVNYVRELDQFGRLKKITLFGNAITSNPQNSNSNFSNQSVIFEYK